MLLLMLPVKRQVGLLRIYLSGELGQDLVRVSTWSFITWAAVWKEHWFAHRVGWHWPEASDHWLGSAGLIIYPVAYCLHCAAFLPSCPLEHPALPPFRCFTMQSQHWTAFPGFTLACLWAFAVFLESFAWNIELYKAKPLLIAFGSSSCISRYPARTTVTNELASNGLSRLDFLVWGGAL